MQINFCIEKKNFQACLQKINPLQNGLFKSALLGLRDTKLANC